MTTRIGLQVGNIVAIRETDNDARAVSILVAVYEGLGLGPSTAPKHPKTPHSNTPKAVERPAGTAMLGIGSPRERRPQDERIPANLCATDASDSERLMAVTDWLISVLESRAYEVVLARQLAEHRETIEAQVRADTQF